MKLDIHILPLFFFTMSSAKKEIYIRLHKSLKKNILKLAKKKLKITRIVCKKNYGQLLIKLIKSLVVGNGAKKCMRANLTPIILDISR